MPARRSSAICADVISINRSAAFPAACAAALLAAAGAGVGLFAWFATSSFVPLAYAGRPLEYVFLGAPLARLLLVSLASSTVLALAHWRCVPAIEGQRWTCGALGYIAPLTLLGCAPFGALVLARGDVRLSLLTFALVDLRPWWTAAIAAVVLARFDARRGHAWRNAARRVFERLRPSTRLLLLDAALFLLLVTCAIASSRYLRFTAVLHGDEPKYLRLCENLYQGLGLDVANQKTMEELTLAYSPPVWRNLTRAAAAVRQDAGYLASDLRTFVSNGFSAQYNRAEFVEGWFVRGRNGGFYQVHNPGLSLILFPAYFVDRHFLSASADYQGIFPTLLPTTNLLCLLMWAVWGVVVFRFLRAALSRDGLAWLLAAAAMLTMPVAAFPFQIYPEAAAGLIVTAICLWLLFRDPDTWGAGLVTTAGAAVAFLPWLHVRFLILSAVLAMTVLMTLKHRRLAFGLAYAIVICGLCLYSYHITGSLRPDAMYETEGGASPWRLHDALQSMIAYPFDRIWGFLPHAPVFLFALPGWILLARARRRVAALLALIIASVVIPASGHGFTGAGATPLRHLVAVVPLAMVPIGYTLMSWGRRRSIVAAFTILLLLSINASLSYNWHHKKEVGRFVDGTVSGWATNLLFPWTHGEAWARWPGTFVLFLIWTCVCAALLAWPIIARRRAASADSSPITIRFAVATLLAFAVVGTGATALGGEWMRLDYLQPLTEARAAALEYGLALDRCRICYSSFRGEIGRGHIVGDAGHVFTFTAARADIRAGEEAVFVANASARDGVTYGTLGVDFGDDRTSRLEVVGRAEVRHTYDRPGLIHVSARFTPHDSEVQYRSAEVAIRPSSFQMSDASGLDERVADAPIRGTINRVVTGPDGATAEMSDGSRAAVVLLVWDGQRWTATPESSLKPDYWVTVLALDQSRTWRSEPATVRWPPANVTIGSEVELAIQR
jgi:hypothetical protein